MEVHKNLLKAKSSKIILVVIIISLLIICGYLIYENNRKNEIIKNMTITFTDIKEVEYGTKDFDVRKELVKEVKEAELNDIPKIDTTKIGETKLVFTLKKDDVMKEVEHKVSVVDTKAPVISLENDSKEITVGDEYDIKTNIKSVTDVVDGDIALIEDVKTINEKATEVYSKLKKEDIKEDTKVADKSLNDFFIETTKSEDDEKEIITLYLKNCYYIDGSVDSSKAGENKISVVAVDKNGVKSSKDFTVNVKEKEIEQNIASNVVSNPTNNQGSSSSNGSGNSNIGSIYDVVNTALAQIGKPYTYGGRGPDSFDCDGLILYAYRQNGYSMTSTSSTSGYSIGTNMFNAQIGDIIVTPNHVAMISKVSTANYLVEGMEVKYFTVVEASNPGTGIRENTYFPYMIRSDGVYLFSGGGIGTPGWSDIRRIK